MHARTETVVAAPGWRAQMADWCRDFRRLLIGPWRESEANDLFERIESFSVLAELIADLAVADAAAELAVFLCAFTDSQLHPDAGQRRRLEHLAQELESALTSEPEPLQAVPDSGLPARPTFRVLYLRAVEHARTDVEAALRQDNIQVFTVDDLDEALVSIDHSLPDAVILHAEFIDDLHQLTQPGRRHGAAMWRRVLLAGVGIDDDVRVRLHARRAGLDLLLDEDALEAASALSNALLRRRDEGYRVLVVEDDRGHAAFCESLLRHQGFEVDVAPSAEDALERTQIRTPDLILLDINLPDMNGIEVAQLMRDRRSLAHVPIVFLTGEEDMDCRAEAITAGGDDFLIKPVRPRHLLANVNSRIGRARALAMSAATEHAEDGLSQRLDRVRFVETLERLRDEHAGCAGIAVFALDDVSQVAAQLGFVQAGNLALQIAHAIETECGGLGRTCGIGEFSRVALLDQPSAAALRTHADAIRARLTARVWVSAVTPLRIGFSVGIARFDGSSVSGDAVIASAIAQVDRARHEGGGRLSYADMR